MLLFLPNRLDRSNVLAFFFCPISFCTALILAPIWSASYFAKLRMLGCLHIIDELYSKRTLSVILIHLIHLIDQLF